MSFDWSVIADNFAILMISLFILGFAYLSNMAFSLFYNTKLIGEKYDKQKMKVSILKLIVFFIGLCFLNLAILLLIQLAGMLGFEIPSEYQDVISATAIIFTTLLSATFYIKEAYEKYKMILIIKKPE